MDLLDDEIIDLFKTLADNSVKYILVGGFATVLNGFFILTEDVDIWIEDTLQNRKNLNKALVKLGLPDMPQVERIDFVPGWSGINLPSGFQLDIMTSLSGFEKEKFEKCYLLSNEAIVEGVALRFLHINQLIEAKKAANRPKDLLDIEALEKIKKDKDL